MKLRTIEFLEVFEDNDWSDRNNIEIRISDETNSLLEEERLLGVMRLNEEKTTVKQIFFIWEKLLRLNSALYDSGPWSIEEAKELVVKEYNKVVVNELMKLMDMTKGNIKDEFGI